MNKVLVIGGAGYVGCVLVPKLLDRGFRVTVYDLMLYGSHGLFKHPNLEVITGDVRNIELLRSALDNSSAVIHLACISNDPSFELNPELSKSINFDSFDPTVKAAKSAGVERFIFASSSSVYGVSDAPAVTEEHPLVPITDYNKYKGLCEKVLFQYQDDRFNVVSIRPATVCGYSPRMRFDLTVNVLTNHAVRNKKIIVFGGEQKRPNIHIEDISDLYIDLLHLPTKLFAGQTFNAGYENHTVADLALLVRSVVEQEIPESAPIEIVRTESDDIRSYHVCSEKIKRTIGFEPKRTIEDAVRDLCRAFRENKLPNSLEDSHYFNVKTVKNLNLV